MSNKIDEIKSRADRYRGKAAGVRVNVYCADVDWLMAEIDRLTGELEQKTLALYMALTKISELEHPNYHDTQTLTIKSPQGKDGE